MKMEPARSSEPEWGCLIAPVVVLLVIAFAVLSLVKQVDDKGQVLEREVSFVAFGPQTAWHSFTVTYSVDGDVYTSGIHSEDAYVKLDPSLQDVGLVIREVPMRNLLGTWHGGKTEVIMTVPDWNVDLGMPEWRTEFRGNRQDLVTH